MGVKRASSLRRTGPSALRPVRYRRFSQTWGCYPITLAGPATSADLRASIG